MKSTELVNTKLGDKAPSHCLINLIDGKTCSLNGVIPWLIWGGNYLHNLNWLKRNSFRNINSVVLLLEVVFDTLLCIKTFRLFLFNWQRNPMFLLKFWSYNKGVTFTNIQFKLNSFIVESRTTVLASILMFVILKATGHVNCSSSVRLINETVVSRITIA